MQVLIRTRKQRDRSVQAGNHMIERIAREIGHDTASFLNNQHTGCEVKGA